LYSHKANFNKPEYQQQLCKAAVRGRAAGDTAEERGDPRPCGAPAGTGKSAELYIWAGVRAEGAGALAAAEAEGKN